MHHNFKYNPHAKHYYSVLTAFLHINKAEMHMYQVLVINLTVPNDAPSVFLMNNDTSLDARKPVFGVSDQVRHKPACTSSEKS